MQDVMIKAGLPVSRVIDYEPTYIPVSTEFFGLVNVYQGERPVYDRKMVPSNAFKSIISANPNGKYIHK